MSTCSNTGLTVPECSCAHCIERQLERFAPGFMPIRALPEPPLPLEARSTARALPSAAERLTRPAL